jgi:putative redox protein
MGKRSQKFNFENGRSQMLAGILDLPETPPIGFGVFSPCFTCVKESHAAVKICRGLAERGIGMLRFDTTGLGGSEGDFSSTNFSSRVLDIIAAANAVKRELGPTLVLVGHSISGTAALSAAKYIPDLKILATIGAPDAPQTTIEKFRKTGVMNEKGSQIEINVLGTPYLFQKSFVDDMLKQKVEHDTVTLQPELLVFHAPNDAIVSVDSADRIAARKTNRSHKIILDQQATHLFENRKEDAEFVAATICDRLESILEQLPRSQSV